MKLSETGLGRQIGVFGRFGSLEILALAALQERHEIVPVSFHCGPIREAVGDRSEENARARSPVESVFYVLADATIRSVHRDGTSSEPANAGEVFWRDDTTHAVENVGATEARALAIEWKACTR